MLTASNLIYIIPAIFISLAIHEAIHAFAAYSLGDNTAKYEGRLTLNPLKHVDLYTSIVLPIITILIFGFPVLIAKPVPFDPDKVRFGEFGAAIVGVSGPISNFILAALAGLIIDFTSLPVIVSNFLLTFIEINVFMFIINMIPVPPLDGSRLLYAFAPQSLQSIMRRFESSGYLAIFVIIILIFYFFTGSIDYCANHVLNFLVR
jgi:Zn-dependent protease